MNKRQKVLRYMGMVLIAYVILCVLLLLRQNSMIFLPPQSSYDKELEHLQFTKTEAGESIAMQVHVPEGAPAIVVYTHGNAVDIGQLSFRGKYFQGKGLGYCLLEYPGYGLSSGSPSERAAYESVDACVAFLAQHYPDLPIIFYGRSVGTGIAVYAAVKYECLGLVLESPMRSAQRVLLPIRIFPWDVFNNQARIKEIEVPVLFIHGELDRVIPISHGRTLAQLCPGTFKTCWLPNEDHNSILLIEKTVNQHLEEFFAHLSLAPVNATH